MPEERKLVTILFADVSGSTTLGERLDPEDVRALMSQYYAHAQRLIPEHGGTLEKFIGDAAMAVFGLPHAHGNDAERGASERTVAAAESGFLFGEARLGEVKGKARPLRVFPLVGPRPARQMKRPPFIGRRQDLAQLNLLWERALEEQRPQLVSIVAPAGTGKTRLLEEFLAQLDPAAGWKVATARCLPYGQTLAYWPLRPLLDALLGSQFSAKRIAEAFVAAQATHADVAV